MGWDRRSTDSTMNTLCKDLIMRLRFDPTALFVGLTTLAILPVAVSARGPRASGKAAAKAAGKAATQSQSVVGQKQQAQKSAQPQNSVQPRSTSPATRAGSIT